MPHVSAQAKSAPFCNSAVRLIVCACEAHSAEHRRPAPSLRGGASCTPHAHHAHACVLGIVMRWFHDECCAQTPSWDRSKTQTMPTIRACVSVGLMKVLSGDLPGMAVPRCAEEAGDCRILSSRPHEVVKRRSARRALPRLADEAGGRHACKGRSRRIARRNVS